MPKGGYPVSLLSNSPRGLGRVLSKHIHTFTWSLKQHTLCIGFVSKPWQQLPYAMLSARLLAAVMSMHQLMKSYLTMFSFMYVHVCFPDVLQLSLT